MHKSEQIMSDILTDLRDNYLVKGVKAEFETEGTSLDEALRLKDLCAGVNLGLTIKIGGCGAIKDMYEAKNIGVHSLVAPMIESEYALEKFITSAKSVWKGKSARLPELFINLETLTGFEHLDKIVNSPYFKNLSGIVLGRTDLAASLGESRDFVNSGKIFDMASVIATAAKKSKKKFIIGGGVSPESVEFFKKTAQIHPTGFETRKIIFDAHALNLPNITDGIRKAVKFEQLWLKNKRGNILSEDKKRLKMLDEILNNMVD